MIRRLALPLLVLSAMLALRASVLGAPVIMNDSVQFLSAARSLLDRGESATSIVHFDVERSAGRLPAPLTWFPPGYPAALAALSALGLSLETAALALGVLASALVLWLLALAARELGLSAGASAAVLLACAVNAQVASHAVYALSEPLFTAVALGAAVLVLADARRPGWWRPVAASLLFGLSYWIRYAGLLLVAAVHVHALLLSLRDRRRAAPWGLGLLACDAVVGACMLRNVLLMGSWRGGNTHPHQTPLWKLGRASFGLVRQLFFGPSKTGVAVALSLAALALLLFAARRARRRPLPLPLVLLVAVYAAGVVYLSATSPVSFHARMFVPVLPLLLLLLAAWLDGQLARRAALGCLGAYAAANVVSSFAPSMYLSARDVERDLAPVAPFIRGHVPADAVLLATEGQLTGFVLDRPTVSVIDARYSDLRWTEPEARQVADTFHVAYVLVLPHREAPGMFAGLARGQAPPWLELAASSGSALVYRRVPR